jgi:hypothetical protein
MGDTTTLMDPIVDSTQQEFNDAQNSMTSFENDNVDSNDQDSNMNSNRQDNMNSNSHEAVNNSYDQENVHPNSENEQSFDDNGRGPFRYGYFLFCLLIQCIIIIVSIDIFLFLFIREFRDGNGQFDNNYGSSEYRNGSNWNNGKGSNDAGRFGGFGSNNMKGTSNYRSGSSSYGFNSPTNGGFKPQRSRWSSENQDENWSGAPQDSSPNVMNGPPPTQGGPQFGENQVPPFNEQESSGQLGAPLSNQLPSLLQV